MDFTRSHLAKIYSSLTLIALTFIFIEMTLAHRDSFVQRQASRKPCLPPIVVPLSYLVQGYGSIQLDLNISSNFIAECDLVLFHADKHFNFKPGYIH